VFNASTLSQIFSPIKEFVLAVKMLLFALGSDAQRDGFSAYSAVRLCGRWACVCSSQGSCRSSGSPARVRLRPRANRPALLCDGFAEYRYEI
jgi:hypothetical protein